MFVVKIDKNLTEVSNMDSCNKGLHTTIIHELVPGRLKRKRKQIANLIHSIDKIQIDFKTCFEPRTVVQIYAKVL